MLQLLEGYNYVARSARERVVRMRGQDVSLHQGFGLRVRQLEVLEQLHGSQRLPWCTQHASKQGSACDNFLIKQGALSLLVQLLLPCLNLLHGVAVVLHEVQQHDVV